MENKSKSKNTEASFDLDKLKHDYYKNAQKNKEKQLKSLNKTLFVCICLLAVLCTYIIYTLLQYKKDLAANEEIKQISISIIEDAAEAIDDEPAFYPAPDIIGEDFGTYINPEIQYLREFFDNEDIVGYITIEGTEISYPVLQSDDNEYYLNNDIYGSANSAGSIFLDYENEADFSNQNNVIYGHNMKDGSMFHNLRYYEDYEFYENHNTISLITMNETTTWEIYTFFKTDVEFNYIQVQFSSADEAFVLLSQMKELSAYDTGVEISPEDKVLTLSTCTNQSESTRYVVSAKLID